MPELPEVENLRRALEPALSGRRLRSFEHRRRDLRWPMPVATVRALAGHRLRSVERRGKWLVLGMDRRAPSALLIHLGMSGRLRMEHGVRSARLPWDPHEHWRLVFEGRVLRYVDPRRFGALLAAPAASVESHPRLAGIGPDPLSPGLDGDVLFRRARRRRVTLKSFLLDPRNVAGVGNIYACEACFEAGLRPQKRVHRLTRSACEGLHAALRAVLERALRAGGTTLRDYAGLGGEPGRFQARLSVYGRAGEPCPACGTSVAVTRQAGRSTYWCPRCQR